MPTPKTTHDNQFADNQVKEPREQYPERWGVRIEKEPWKKGR